MPLKAPEPVKKSFKLQMLQAREVAITRAVNRLLAEKGFDAMTVDEVAAEVGIAKASLYKHFSSKEALACAAMVQAMQRAQEFICGLESGDAQLLASTALAKLQALTRWTLGLKLSGQMPSLPSQNSSLRASLMASRPYMDALMQVSEILGTWVVKAQAEGVMLRESTLDDPARIALGVEIAAIKLGLRDNIQSNAKGGVHALWHNCFRPGSPKAIAARIVNQKPRICDGQTRQRCNSVLKKPYISHPQGPRSTQSIILFQLTHQSRNALVGHAHS